MTSPALTRCHREPLQLPATGTHLCKGFHPHGARQ
jgi:hypothetical protein